MFHIVHITLQFTHQHFMKMSEMLVNKSIFINNYDIKLAKIYNIIEIYMILYIFLMHRTIIVNIKLLVGSQPTCRPDQKGHMADCIIFKF